MGYVNMPIPEERVAEVYELLARPPATDRKASPSASSNGLLGGWSQELLERSYRESPGPMRAFYRHLAEHPGQEFTLPEMAEAIERTTRQLPGVLGAYGRRAANRYSMDTWPFHAEYRHERGAVYSMDDREAAIIRRLMPE